jgi:ABC-2 type transport system ATP-binding protein
LDLEAWANKAGQQLSGGIRRLTAFCMAAAEPGRVVMLDEPTNDVDPVRRRLLWRQIRALAADEGCAVLLVTHGVIEAERVIDRMVVLHHGRIIAEGTPAQLRGSHDDRLRLELLGVSESATAGLSPPLSITRSPAVVAGNRVTVTIGQVDVTTAIDWAQRLLAAGTISEFAVNPASLEDVYIGLVGEREEDGDATLAA